MKTAHIPTTATAVEKLRKEAKALVRSSGHRLHQCLDAVAAQAGYQHWKHVTECLEVTNSDRKPVRWNQPIHTPSGEGKSFAAVGSSATPTPATVDQFDPGQQYLDGIASQGLAPVVSRKPVRAIFHDVVIEGRRFAAAMADDIYLCVFNSAGTQVGNCPLGAARINGRTVNKFWNEARFSVSGLSDQGVRALMVEFGIAQDDYRGPLPLLFYASKAFESLVEWSKRHPKLSRQYGQAGQYLRHWGVQVRAAIDSRDKDGSAADAILEAEMRALSDQHRLSLLFGLRGASQSIPFAQALRDLSGVHARLANQPGAPEFTFVVKPRRGVVQALELPGSADVFKQALGIESPEGEDNAPGRSERPRG